MNEVGAQFSPQYYPRQRIIMHVTGELIFQHCFIILDFKETIFSLMEKYYVFFNKIHL